MWVSFANKINGCLCNADYFVDYFLNIYIYVYIRCYNGAKTKKGSLPYMYTKCVVPFIINLYRSSTVQFSMDAAPKLLPPN